MLFPETERVIYRKNPLKSVLSQLRFPTILRLNTELPITFQESLRKDYPFYQERSDTNVFGDIEQLPREAIEGPFREKNIVSHNFFSSDRHWTVTLTRDYLSLATDIYRDWDSFMSRLSEVQDSFEKIYSPTFYYRVGLRYQDVIRPSELDIKVVDWSSLIEAHLAGELANPVLSKAVAEIFQTVLFNLPQYDGQVRVQHGLVIAQDGTNEQCYLIDNDFFTNRQTELENARDILTYFNKENGNFFRSVIRDDLKHALGA